MPTVLSKPFISQHQFKKMALACLRWNLPAEGIARPVFSMMYKLHRLKQNVMIWGEKFFWSEPLLRSQCVSVGEGLIMQELPHMMGQGAIKIGDQVRLSGKQQIAFSSRYKNRPDLSIGDHTFIGHNVSFAVSDEITIGRHCMIAGNVSFMDMDGHPVDWRARADHQPTPAAQIRPIHVGDHVWIGNGALILKGVKIGDRSIIAARSVVTKDVPPDTIVAGNPARVVGSTLKPKIFES